MRRLLSVFIVTAISLAAQANQPAAEYRIYAGSTHAHTAYTWSHGEQWAKGDCAGIQVYAPNPKFPGISTWSDGYVKSKTGCAGIFVINGLQYPSPGMVLKPNWTEVQGLPSKHFELARKNGYDFYTTTDHSQESGFQSPGAWAATKQQAAQASGSDFVALAGFEYSENDGPGGQGHINVINSAGMLNALAPGIDLPYFYNWLKTAQSNGDGPVVASFNHPGAAQYNNWDYRDPQVTDIITMLEVINSNNKIHYEGFVKALDKGWKVSPVCGNDNHGLSGIPKHTSRTFVLAKSRTKADILDAMKNRRTYASLDRNIQCRYSVNGAIMGSTLDRPGVFQFNIAISDAKDRITKIDIVRDGGVVAQSHTPAPGSSVEWSPAITDSASKYFFVRVWTARGGDAPGADPEKPVAWLAPVWTGR